MSGWIKLLDQLITAEDLPDLPISKITGLQEELDTLEQSLHTHANKAVLDSITEQKLSDWDTAVSWGDHATEGYAKDTDVLKKDNNLSDLPSKATARSNLELGTAALLDAGVTAGDVPVLQTGGVLAVDRVPGLPASKITSGAFGVNRIQIDGDLDFKNHRALGFVAETGSSLPTVAPGSESENDGRLFYLNDTGGRKQLYVYVYDES